MTEIAAIPDIATEKILFGPDIDADLGITDRTRRNYINAEIIPPADGNFCGRDFWLLSNYRQFKANLLAGRFAKPVKRPPSLRRDRSVAA